MFWKRKSKRNTKKVSLVGWYGEGAHGDDVMKIATRKLFEDLAKSRGISIEWVNEKQADLVIVGGGSILGVDRMRLYGRLKNVRAPLVFFGGGFRREKRDIGPDAVKHIKYLLHKAMFRGVRGYLTQQFFIHIGVVDVEVIGDPAITFSPMNVERLPGDFKVGVSIRSMGKTGEPQYIDNLANAENIAKICDYLIEEHGASLYFFDLTENIHDSDKEGVEAVVGIMQHKEGHEYIPFERSTEDIFSLMSQMDYIVSQRLHPTILGWQQDIPHVAFEYQFGKTDDFMQSIGMGEFVMRTDEFDMDIYKKKLARLMKDRKIIVSQAEKSIQYWKDKQKEFAERTLALLD